MNGHAKGVVVEEAKEMIEYGFTPREVADALGIQIGSVAARLRIAGETELHQVFLQWERRERQALREALGKAA